MSPNDKAVYETAGMSVSTLEKAGGVAHNDVGSDTRDTFSTDRPHLTYLDGIRGVCALAVAVHHHDMAWWRNRTGHLGAHWLNVLLMLMAHVAVDVFIVLSGYCLMIPVARRSGKLDVARFAKRRALRILPTYYAALAVCILLTVMPIGPSRPKPLDTGSVLSHLVLLHNLNVRWIFDINGAMWSIATEWQIYVVFVLLLVPAVRRRGLLAATFAACVLSAGPWILIPGFHRLEHACLWYIGLFALGMAAANLNHTNGSHPARIRLWWLAVVFVATIVLNWIAFRQLAAGQFPRIFPLSDMGIGLMTSALLFHSTRSLINGGPSRVVKISSKRFLVWVGGFSYSLYLIHSQVLQRAVVHNAIFSPSSAADYTMSLVTSLSAALFVSYGFFVLFERPILRLMRKAS